MRRSFLIPSMATVLTVMMLAMPAPTAMARKKKKKKKVDDSKIVAEIEEALTPLNETMKQLMGKVQKRLLFTPDDSVELESLKWELTTLIQKYPKRKEIIQAVYQAASLYHRRERYLEAYDFYTFLATHHGKHPYGVRSALAVHKLNQKFGQSMFTVPAEIASAKTPSP